MEVLANWIWQGCVVALAAALLLRVLDRSRAPLRALLCWAGLGAVLALPLLPLLGTSAPVATAGGAPPILVPRAWWTSGVAFGGAWALWFTVAALRLARAALAVRQAKRRCGAFPAALEARLDH